MATYNEIKGVTVQTKDEDPSVFAGSWSSGGALNTARGRLAGAGSAAQTAGLAFGGTNPPSTYKTETEEYNGSAWSEQNDMNTGRDFIHGAGIQTSAACVGGHSSPTARVNTVENYNGSSWTTGTSMNVAAAGRNAAGAAYTAVIAFGGYTPGSSPGDLSTGQVVQTEVWDGSSWTEVNDLNQARFSAGGSGTTTNAIMATGSTSSPGNYVTNVETWNGTSWTETTDVNTARFRLGNAGSGATDQLIFGGASQPGTLQTITEAWNGSSWTEVSDLASAMYEQGSGGPSGTDALSFGGNNPSVATTTQEWTFPSSPILVEGMLFLSGGTTLKGFGKAAGIPAATWASSGSLNTARNGCLLYTSPSPRDGLLSRMPSSA